MCDILRPAPLEAHAQTQPFFQRLKEMEERIQNERDRRLFGVHTKVKPFLGGYGGLEVEWYSDYFQASRLTDGYSLIFAPLAPFSSTQTEIPMRCRLLDEVAVVGARWAIVDTVSGRLILFRNGIGGGDELYTGVLEFTTFSNLSYETLNGVAAAIALSHARDPLVFVYIAA